MKAHHSVWDIKSTFLKKKEKVEGWKFRKAFIVQERTKYGEHSKPPDTFSVRHRVRPEPDYPAGNSGTYRNQNWMQPDLYVLNTY